MKFYCPYGALHVNRSIISQYFSIYRFPSSGSLIRAEKINKFETLEEAIRERYITSEKQSYINDELLMEARDALSAPFMKVCICQ